MSKIKRGLLFIGVIFMVLLVQQPYSVQTGETAIAKAATVKINKKRKTLNNIKSFPIP